MRQPFSDERCPVRTILPRPQGSRKGEVCPSTDQLVGFAPDYDREVGSDGAVKRIFEAVYGKVLVPEGDMLRPDPANLTPRTKALFEQMFPTSTP
ncbi:hypothetical protein DN412_21380 [Cupriavidus lacunae]|uniref:Uncharacterized protein n=1 Tax=Cupriavidus lacunae TaxID=2666307 RepID=A0A370NS04_9BURK|nr:hypothetical protein DN412_21380 [Cupriavidus lacunae]